MGPVNPISTPAAKVFAFGYAGHQPSINCPYIDTAPFRDIPFRQKLLVVGVVERQTFSCRGYAGLSLVTLRVSFSGPDLGSRTHFIRPAACNLVPGAEIPEDFDQRP